MPQIMIVGEAYGEHEERQRTPFVGPAGYELTRMLEEAGIRRVDCHLTNVFNLRPANNDIDTLCCPKKEDRSGLPALRPGKYLRSEYLHELTRLRNEMSQVRPNLVLALGNTATWAILHNSGISKLRGTVTSDRLGLGLKVLPAYHPAAILRQWELRHVTILDFIKAKREAEFPEIRRPERVVYIEPSLSDLEWFYGEYLESSRSIAFDIETSGDQITCIGFAPNATCSLVVPFVDARRENRSYWKTLEEERAAWLFVRKVLSGPQRKIAQNGLYDVTFLWRQYGIPVTNFAEDTMLLHHALQPESPKGLGFLGSVYTNESSWKLLRTRGKKTIKKED